ncbi:MAG: GNAT family N-acetyltransferase [Paracoccus sp. (in: a-proteobacteria)]|uniref:GNAT family N-acetyltransferase n=1 Tax=unclassified Paracoccus (in: a-proteobacteria) TaxID=2688777 RepID=UPI002369D91E|nr:MULTISPECIES: GNAT family N-acetyltransferase [unclassified Paracoccus (in: a-proteobacteria)]MDB2552304.1 GNAT family N-acetyltransferase [Paracoccus sp. (in: a-proteobacteria)]
MNESHPCSSDGADLTIAVENPLAADLAPLFRRHWAEMHADTPPESNHALPREGLAVPEIAFFVARRNGFAVAMGALKRLCNGHAEIKSMHVLAEYRGAGLSRLLLVHMIDHARRDGLTQLSLETGAQASFAAARALYGRAGFSICPPFGAYREDPNSVFMTLAL